MIYVNWVSKSSFKKRKKQGKTKSFGDNEKTKEPRTETEAEPSERTRKVAPWRHQPGKDRRGASITNRNVPGQSETLRQVLQKSQARKGKDHTTGFDYTLGRNTGEPRQVARKTKPSHGELTLNAKWGNIWKRTEFWTICWATYHGYSKYVWRVILKTFSRFIRKMLNSTLSLEFLKNSTERVQI